ncbi:MAG: nucleotide exchange factor GrpE [Candidatus Brocadiales bacterium]
MEQKFAGKSEENQSPTSTENVQASQPPEKSEEKEPQEIEIKEIPGETVKQELEDAKTRANQLFEALQRLAADFENYKKRIAKERQEFILSSKAEFILKLLDIYEGLQKAISASSSDIDSNYLNGIKMLYDEFSRTLKNEGLEPIETVGKSFDVHKHEVLLRQVNDDLSEDTILEEIQAGYMLNSRVLRHAKVIVSQKSPPPTEEKHEKVEG